jgi:hypothetical protein
MKELNSESDGAPVKEICPTRETKGHGVSTPPRMAHHIQARGTFLKMPGMYLYKYLYTL